MKFIKNITKGINNLVNGMGNNSRRNDLRNDLENDSRNDLENNLRNYLENRFRTYLMLYCLKSDIESARNIIDIVGDLNFIDETCNESPLTLAVERNSLEMVKLLIEHGANVDLKNDKGHTPLILAVKKNSPEMVKLLIEHGANVDLKNDKGRTPLIYATKEFETNDDAINIIKTLIKHDANINIADEKGRTPLMWACTTQLMYLIGELEEVDDEIDRSQIQRERLNKDYLVNLLLQKGANIHMMDKDGKTALMHAIDCSSKEVIESLLKNNGIPKYTNKACMGLNINDFDIAKQELDCIQKSEWYKFEEQQIKEFSELIETLNDTSCIEDIKQMLQEKYKAIDDKISIQINTLDNLVQRGVKENFEEFKKVLVIRSRNVELQAEILDIQKLVDDDLKYAKNKLLNEVDKAKNNLDEIKNLESRIDVYEKKEILDMIDLSKKTGVKVANIKNYKVQTTNIKPKHKGFLRCME